MKSKFKYFLKRNFVALFLLFFISCEDKNSILSTEKSIVKQNKDYKIKLSLDPDIVYLNSSTNVTATVTRLNAAAAPVTPKTIKKSNTNFDFSVTIDPDTVYTGTNANITATVTRLNNLPSYTNEKSVSGNNDRFKFDLSISPDTVYSGSEAIVTATVTRLVAESALPVSYTYNYYSSFEATDGASLNLISTSSNRVEMKPVGTGVNETFSTSATYKRTYKDQKNSLIIATFDGMKIELPIVNIPSFEESITLEVTGGATIDPVLNSSGSIITVNLDAASGSSFSSDVLYTMSNSDFSSSNLLFAKYDGMTIELPIVNILSSEKLTIDAVGGTIDGQNFTYNSNISVSLGSGSSSTFEALAFFIPKSSYNKNDGYFNYQQNGHVSASFNGMNVTLSIKLVEPR